MVSSLANSVIDQVLEDLMTATKTIIDINAYS